MPGFKTITQPRAAYRHRCEECEEWIEAGERYVSQPAPARRSSGPHTVSAHFEECPR